MEYKLTHQAVMCLNDILESIRICPVCAKQCVWLKKNIEEIKEENFSVADYEKKLGNILASMHRQIEMGFLRKSANCEKFSFLHMKLLHIFQNRFFMEKRKEPEHEMLS
jgi:hypothetical protein